MGAKKGSRCFNCRSFKMRDLRGVWQCSGCGSVEWSMFTRPAAGEPRKGFRCYCGNQTVHPVGEVAGALVSRCSVCGYTFVEPKPPEAP